MARFSTEKFRLLSKVGALEVLFYVGIRKKATYSELMNLSYESERFSISERSLKNRIRELRKLNFLRRDGRGKYTLTLEGVDIFEWLTQSPLEFAKTMFICEKCLEMYPAESGTPRKCKNCASVNFYPGYLVNETFIIEPYVFDEFPGSKHRPTPAGTPREVFQPELIQEERETLEYQKCTIRCKILGMLLDQAGSFLSKKLGNVTLRQLNEVSEGLKLFSDAAERISWKIKRAADLGLGGEPKIFQDKVFWYVNSIMHYDIEIVKEVVENMIAEGELFYEAPNILSSPLDIDQIINKFIKAADALTIEKTITTAQSSFG
jgi:hypothetical protein